MPDGKLLKKHGHKMNYLLVMPRLIQNSGDGYSFPLGICYISAVMKKAGFNVVTVNLNHEEGSVYDVLKRLIEQNNIDVVATGGLSFQYNTIKLVIDAAKKINNGVKIVVGGGIIAGDPEPAMDALESVDFGIIGEGENTIKELCSCMENGGDFSAVDGLIFKRVGAYVFTKPRKEIDDIDTIPWPDYEGFKIGDYLSSTPPGISGLNEHNTIFMLASRSCPYNCTFCFHTVGKKYRQKSMDAFFKELDYMVSKYKIEFICMADELFARDIKRVKEFCDRIKKYSIRWWAQFRVDDITPELIEILKNGGCEVMSFGLESADNRILKSMRKHTTLEQIENALKLTYDSGISLEGAFIFGDIEETAETAANTLKWWREHIQYRINLNLITVYPGAYLYHYAVEKGIIKDKVKFLKDGCPQVNVSKMSDGELSDLVNDIINAPLSVTQKLSAVKLLGVDYVAGRIDVEGACRVCGQTNVWKNIKLFTTNFLSCEKCGQKYSIPLPDSLLENIEKNIGQILGKYGKVGIWAVNFNTSYLFKKAKLFSSDGIFPIDISETKRKMNFHGKKIYPPEIVNIQALKVIVVAIPAFMEQIETQVRTFYKGVIHVIDLCDLLNPDYKI